MAEITGFWQSNLRDLLAELGEERTSEILSAFECPLNPDVQSFLREKALLFFKARLCVHLSRVRQLSGQYRLNRLLSKSKEAKKYEH